MPFDTKHVTNAILQRSFRESRTDMSPMKLQKILFFLNGWHLAITGRAAIDEPFEVWPYGPVVSDIYHEVKGFGSSNINTYVKSYDSDTKAFVAYVPSEQYKQFYEILDLTWEKYIGISATRLSAMTHEPGSPWDIARRNGESIIREEIIRDYFVDLAKRTA